MNEQRDKEWLAAISRGLARESEQLRPDIQARLQAARERALAAGSKAPATRPVARDAGWGRWLDNWIGKPVWQAAALASVAVLAVTVLLSPQGLGPSAELALDDPFVQEAGTVGNVADVLMSNEEMDFLENLELFEWLAAEYG